MIITAFMLPRFFAQTHMFSVSELQSLADASFSLSPM